MGKLKTKMVEYNLRSYHYAYETRHYAKRKAIADYKSIKGCGFKRKNLTYTHLEIPYSDISFLLDSENKQDIPLDFIIHRLRFKETSIIIGNKFDFDEYEFHTCFVRYILPVLYEMAPTRYYYYCHQNIEMYDMGHLQALARQEGVTIRKTMKQLKDAIKNDQEQKMGL